MDWDMLPDLAGFYSTFASRDGAVPSYVGGITNDGFADPNPQNAFTDLGTTGLFSDFGPENTGALIDLKLGSFEPGQSKAFDIYYGVDHLAGRRTNGRDQRGQTHRCTRSASPARQTGKRRARRSPRYSPSTAGTLARRQG
ncbi:hypothetical protein [Micromonospora sp. NPDC005237]|uniref:hypothetical protein n=1 Tax=Micromonospora sp. NPDC005237 TaxID=3155113 RepID=UPI0033A633BC